MSKTIILSFGFCKQIIPQFKNLYIHGQLFYINTEMTFSFTFQCDCILVLWLSMRLKIKDIRMKVPLLYCDVCICNNHVNLLVGDGRALQFVFLLIQLLQQFFLLSQKLLFLRTIIHFCLFCNLHVHYYLNNDCSPLKGYLWHDSHVFNRYMLRIHSLRRRCFYMFVRSNAILKNTVSQAEWWHVYF